MYASLTLRDRDLLAQRGRLLFMIFCHFNGNGDGVGGVGVICMLFRRYSAIHLDKKKLLLLN
jgi:hypothetical protein